MITFSKRALSTLPLVAVLSATVFLSACAGGGGAPQFPPSVVDAEPVDVTTWTSSYIASGTLEANNKVDMNVETGGTITGLYFNEGQRISKGQTLVRLKADKYAAQVNQAAAGIQSATQDAAIQDAEIARFQAMVNSAASRRKLAENEFKRFERLFQEQFISGQELDQRRTNFDTTTSDYEAAQRELSAARARKKSATSTIAQAQSNFRYTQAVAGETVLRAPFNGRVGQKYISVGDYAAPGQKIVTVVDDSLYKVKFSVPERYLSMLHQDQPVLISEDGQFGVSKKVDPLTQSKPDNALIGRVIFIDPVIDPQSRTVTLKALVKDPEGHLRHGQSIIAKLLLDKIPGALVIPEEAIVSQGEKTLVYVVHPLPVQAAAKPAAPNGMPSPTDQVALQEVVVGFRDAGRAQIVSGLKAGDRIVTGGLQKVFDGAPVLLSKQSQQKPKPPQTSEVVTPDDASSEAPPRKPAAAD